jgi:hypothetical protein
MMAGAAVLIAAARPAPATSVVPMSVPVMADCAAVVIVGEVAAIEASWRGTPRTIESAVTLRRVEYLKGAPSGGAPARDTFRLTVPGGEVDGVRLRIAGAPEFGVGQTWVLFVLPEWRVHPVVGISQGAFRVEAAGHGTRRVHQGGRAVTGLDREGFVVGASGAEQGMTLSEFLGAIGPAVRSSRVHDPVKTPGTRVTADWTAVPLRSAPETGR